MKCFHSQHEGWWCQGPGFLEGSLGHVGDVSHGPGSWDHEPAELARLTNTSFSCLLPPSGQLPRNAHKYKTDFVFGMFWSINSKGCIKAFLWGWLSTGKDRAGAPDHSIAVESGMCPRNATCRHAGWIRVAVPAGSKRRFTKVLWVPGSSEEPWAGIESPACSLPLQPTGLGQLVDPGPYSEGRSIADFGQAVSHGVFQVRKSISLNQVDGLGSFLLALAPSPPLLCCCPEQSYSGIFMPHPRCWQAFNFSNLTVDP